ncbi:hypothetical protein AB7M49_004667 [Bradyrhizobium elkanii]|nr:hypothetical protein [Bradyrhizobium elkanii]
MGPCFRRDDSCDAARRVHQTSEEGLWRAQRFRPSHLAMTWKVSYPASTASAPVTASALSVTVFSSDGACTAMFSAKKRASAT